MPARHAAVAALVVAALAAACGGGAPGSGVASTGGATTGAGRTETVPSTGTASVAPATDAATTEAAPASVADDCDVPEARAFARVALTTADGVRLDAALGGRGRVGVVLAHQARSSLCGWLPYAAELAASARVLVLDLRGYGRSDPGPAGGLARLDLDVAAGVAELRRRGARRVVLLGASMGGTAVLAATRQRPRPAAAVALSAPPSYPDVEAAPALAHPLVPILLVAAEDDAAFAADAADLASLAHGDPRVRLLVVPSGGHGYALVAPGSPSRNRVDHAIRAVIAGAPGR